MHSMQIFHCIDSTYTAFHSSQRIDFFCLAKTALDDSDGRPWRFIHGNWWCMIYYAVSNVQNICAVLCNLIRWNTIQNPLPSHCHWLCTPDFPIQWIIKTIDLNGVIVSDSIVLRTHVRRSSPLTSFSIFDSFYAFFFGIWLMLLCCMS